MRQVCGIRECVLRLVSGQSESCLCRRAAPPVSRRGKCVREVCEVMRSEASTSGTVTELVVSSLCQEKENGTTSDCWHCQDVLPPHSSNLRISRFLKYAHVGETGRQTDRETEKCLLTVHISIEPGIACWLEHQTRNRKVTSSNPGRSGGKTFFCRVNFVC